MPSTRSEPDPRPGVEAPTVGRLRQWQRFHIKLTGAYAVAVFVTLTVIGLLVYGEGVDAEIDALQKRLRATVAALAVGLPSDEMAQVHAGRHQTLLHAEVHERLRAVAAADPDVNSIYVLMRTDVPGQLEFFTDSSGDGHDEAAPFEAYDATKLPVLLRGLERLAVEDELFEDRWGASMSGYAPLTTRDGRKIGLVGMDVLAKRIDRLRDRLLLFAALLYGFAAVLLGAAAWFVGRSIRDPLTRIIDATAEIARGRFDTRLSFDRHDEFGMLGHHFNEMAGGLQERDFIRATFGRYVSEEVAEAVLASGSAPALGGEERVVSVLFSDLRGYSTITESLSPIQVVDMLNEYLGAMNEVIDRHHGCVIEYLGDAILAVFNAPNRLEDHEARAVRCAEEMTTRLAELNATWGDTGLAELWRQAGIESLRQRIGVHTGPVVCGNLGSRTRMKYAVIGDNVNVAARLEALNNTLGTDLCFSGEVFDRLPAELADRARDLGPHAVKGREQPVRVYTL